MTTRPTNREIAERVQRHPWYRLRMLWREKPSVEQIAEVIEAERREPGGWESFENGCHTVGSLTAGAFHPHQHDITRRLKRDCGYGSIAVVMAVVNVILGVLKLLRWWEERR